MCRKIRLVGAAYISSYEVKRITITNSAVRRPTNLDSNIVIPLIEYISRVHLALLLVT